MFKYTMFVLTYDKPQFVIKTSYNYPQKLVIIKWYFSITKLANSKNCALSQNVY